MEQWKDLAEFPNYQVSSEGRIMSKVRNIIRKSHQDSSGYLQIKLCKNGKTTTKRIHTLVANAFLGTRPTGHDICHEDGDKQNNRLVNLRYDTREGNIQDSILHGTRPIGVKHGRAKLSELQVKLIRALSGLGLRNGELSKLFSVSDANICMILNRTIWNHI